MSTFINILKGMENFVIKNSYINDNTCVDTSETRNRKISQLLETEPKYAAEYNI